MTPQRIFREHAKAVSYLKVALVTLPLIFLVVLANNERIDATRRHADRLYRFSINHEACLLRTISGAQINRLELTKTKGYIEAEGFWRKIKDNQFTIPFDLNCKTLPAKPPR